MAKKDDARFERLLNTFRAESKEHIQAINRALLNFERTSDDEERVGHLQSINRAAHNIKGAARMVGVDAIEIIAHALESVVQAALAGEFKLDADASDLLYDALDMMTRHMSGEDVNATAMQNRLNALIGIEPITPELPVTDTSESDPAPVRDTINDDTIRVSTNKLDDLIAQVSELQVSRMNADHRLHDLKQFYRQFQSWVRDWDEAGLTISRQLSHHAALRDLIQGQSEKIQDLVYMADALIQDVSRDTIQLNIVSDELRDHVRAIRLLPFQSIALGLERAVRDAAQVEGKSVVFRITGEDTELDKRVLEILKDPLMHLLRNAVSHGVEAPEIRTDLGKTPQGKINLIVHQRGNEVAITVEDDGRGFDLDALKATASHHIDGEVTSEEIIQLAFRPGVTTAARLSPVSGRGIGLDVVRDQLETIHGRISVVSAPDEGTRIEIAVPISLAITRALLVGVGRQLFAIPLLAIEKLIEVHDSVDVNGTPMVLVDKTHIPLIGLGSVLGITDTKLPDKLAPRALVMQIAESRVALLVDSVHTEQELSVKPMGYLLQDVPHVTGAAMLSNGQPIVVLNPADILRTARQSNHTVTVNITPTDPQQVEMRARVLVVDDSITTRTLEQNILEAAGYDVLTAKNGIEALGLLAERAFDIVISDVQMPHMDGIGLTESIRQDPELSSLPVILVTSLEKREDKERGMLAGADAYIVKRGFNQAELLTTIRRFTGESTV